MLWTLVPAALAGDTSVHLVLDVDWDSGLVAFKDIVHEESFDQEWIDCKYGGMTDRPTSGVTLGLANAKTGDIQRWHIYEQATSQSGCTPPAEQQSRLAAAKKAFAAAGLDIDAKKTESGATPNSKGVATVGGQAVTTTEAELDADVAAEADRKEMKTASIALQVDGKTVRTHHHWWSRYTNVYGYTGRIEGVWSPSHTGDSGDTLLVRYASVGSGMRGEFSRSHWAMVDGDEPKALPPHLPDNALDPGKIVAVSLLGTKGRHAAVKLVATDDEARDEPCDYAGMPTGQGVLLGLWDLEDERFVRGWPVYDWKTERPCTDRETSERELADAKRRFTNLGIDISKPLDPVAVTDGEVEVAGVGWTAKEGTVSRDGTTAFTSDAHNLKKLVFTTAWAVPGGVVFAYGRPWKSGAIELELTPVLPR